MTYRIPTKVVKLENKKQVLSARIVDEATVTEVMDLGWFVLFEGSQEFLYIGANKPEDLRPGTEVDIIIEPKKHKCRLVTE